MTRARVLGVAGAVLSGVALAVQTRINGELAAELRDGVAAAVISFGTGLLLLAIVTPAMPAARRGVRAIRAALRSGRLRPWHCLGGACGAFMVATQGIAVASIGVAVFTVAMVAGQSASALAVDHAGIGPGRPEPITAARLAGAGLAAVAVLVAVGDRLGNPRTLGLALLPALAGVGVAWQYAVNGRVRQAAGGNLPAALVNFLAGMATLAVAFPVDVALTGWPDGSLPDRPLLYAGGAVGIAFIGLAAAVVRRTGVLLLALGMVAGQVTTALALDVFAPAGAARPGWNTVVGAALTVLAVGIAAQPRRGVADPGGPAAVTPAPWSSPEGGRPSRAGRRPAGSE
jgi:transporter family-2 protein